MQSWKAQAVLACLVCACSLSWSLVAALSPANDSSWLQAQSQLGYNQANQTFGRQTGVTLFPARYAVTAPQGCTHYNGSVNGQTTLDYTTYPVTETEYVARYMSPGGTYVFGKSSGDNCGACNNTCPCANATSWGYFPFQGTELGVAAIRNAPSDVSYTNDTFDILMQPTPDAGFSYIWTNFSSLSSLPSSASVFNLSGSAPCCIPIVSSVAQQIIQDNSPPFNVLDPSDPATWRPQGAHPTGSFMGSCNLASNTASFTWYAYQYNVTMAQGAGNAQVLVMNSTGPTSPPPSIPGPPFITPSSVPPLQTQNILYPVIENVTAAIPDRTHPTQVGGLDWEAAVFPSTCQVQVSNLDGLTTSLPTFPITGNASLYTGGINAAVEQTLLSPLSWYLPYPSGSASFWYVAVLQTNQTTGRPRTSDGAWTFGRAFIDAQTGNWRAFFPKDGVEWNASHLVGTSAFSILGQQSVVTDGQGFLYDEHHTFQYGTASPSAKLASNTFFLNLSGTVPCCIQSYVPSSDLGSNGTETTWIGDVLGFCNPTTSQASITWLGAVYPQDISGAALLTVTVSLRPDPNRTAKIVGGVVGGVGAALIITLLAVIAWQSRRTYPVRARKRLVQDQVYNVVIGVRHTDPYSDEAMKPDDEPQGSINVDRFYNLLPFVNRMPRNRYYANLSASVAGRCMTLWRDSNKHYLWADPLAVHDPTLHGYVAAALAYSLMKHETCYASTEKALVQQWQAGAADRRRLVAGIHEMLSSPELREFLEGMDATSETPEPMTGRGIWATLSRLFFFTLPNCRAKVEAAEPVVPQDAWSADGTTDRGSTDTLHQLTSLRSGMFNGGSGQTAKPAGLSQVLRLMQLDDYQIKPSEIEIMTNLDGSPAILGKGAFGEVFKAKYNSVQIVAVKQLREGGDERAKMDFLREVAIMKKLRAENIVRFLGVCHKEDKTMLVTEYMAGGDLFNQLSVAEAGSELSWRHQGRRIAVDIARGLAFLHGQQIVHFDLKSPNILLAKDHTAKIADVGLARFMNSDHVTQMSVMGTLAWAAPETLRGTSDRLSTKVDIYSFGVVLWEIVTGSSPRFGHSWWRLPRVPEECPAWVANLITDCMKEDPSQRPTSKEIYTLLLADGKPKPEEAPMPLPDV